MHRTITISVLVGFAAAGLTVALTSCTSPAEQPAPTASVTPTASTAEIRSQTTIDTFNDVVEIDHKLSDGRTVTCLVYRGYSKGGLSCDWSRAK